MYSVALMAASRSCSGRAMISRASSQVRSFGMLIDGAIKKPSGLLTDVRKSANFRRLLNLKKSFLPILEKTAKEKALK